MVRSDPITLVTAADGGSKPSIDTKSEYKPTQKPTNKFTIAPVPSKSGKANTTTSGFWPWLSLILAIGWLGTLLIVWRLYRHNTQAPHENPAHKAQAVLASRKLAEKKIKQACMGNNAKAAKEAILTWGKTLYPEKNLNSLTELGEIIGGPIADNLNTLNQVLYSPSANDWQGQSLWNSIQAYNPVQKTTRPQKTDDLAPLYPQ